MSAALAEAVQALADEVAALPRSAAIEAVTAALQRAQALLARSPPARPAEVAPIVQGAAHVLMRLAGDGAEVPLAAAARATDALSASPDRAIELTSLARKEAPPAAFPRASRGRPTLLRPARAPFVWPGAAPPPPAAAAAAEGAGDDLPETPPTVEIGPDAPDPPARPPANDVMMPTPPRPRIRRGEGGAALPVEVFHARALGACLDAVAVLGKQRETHELADRADVEARLLAYSDAAAVTGGDLVARVLAWWQAALESPSPWPSWAAAFFLGLLDGEDALLAVLAGVEKLPPDALAASAAVADALAVSPHPALAAIAGRFVASPHPVARAVGIRVLGRRAPPAPDELRRHLLDPSPAVQQAALRVARVFQATEAAPLLPLVRVSFGLPRREIAAEAARTLSAWGDPGPCEAVRADDRASARLGLDAAEILVRHGRASDLPRLQRLLGRSPTSPAHLSIVARFGHAGAWAYLLHHLADPELADDAADALDALFGARVDETERTSVPAWRSAVEALAPGPDVRYALGEPWHPRALSARLTAGALTAPEAERLHDEVAARLHVRLPLDLAAWSPDEAPARAAVAAEIAAREGRFPAGRWAALAE